MKLTHTLCAALLLGVLSTSAFAQEKANHNSTRSNRTAGVAADTEKPQNKSKKPDCAVAISAKGGNGPAVPAEGCGKEMRAAVKKPCKNAKGLKCSKEERAAAYIKIADIKGESVAAEKPCKNGKGVKCPKPAKADVYLKIEGIKGEAKD